MQKFDVVGKSHSAMSFFKVKLSDWDCSKVTIGKPPKGGEPTILYDGKLPILVIAGNGTDEKYVVSSFKGLQKSRVYDESTKSYTDEWDGEWDISFCVCKSVQEATPLQKKLLGVFADILKKVEDAFEEKVKFPPVSFTWVMVENQMGIKKPSHIDETKGAYIKGKCGYEAPSNAPTMRDAKTKKDVPVFESRKPKASFYDITRALKEMLITDPDTECKTSMNTAPEIFVSVFKNALGLFIQKRVFQCYYEPVEMGSSGPDETLINMLRTGMNLHQDDTD